jgi:hypothetical protein
MSNMG